MEEHLDYSDGGSKNGNYPETVRSDCLLQLWGVLLCNKQSDTGKLDLDIPRDGNSDYRPQLIPKGKTTISGIDDKIISMYVRGMNLRYYRKASKRDVRCRYVRQPNIPYNR